MSSSKLLLPALAAAARLVTGVLYVPLDYVERVTSVGGVQERGGEGELSSSSSRENGETNKEEEERQLIHYEAKYLQETSQQVVLLKQHSV